MAEVVLVGIKTDLDWQLACEAAKHAVKGKKIELVYGTPDGDVALKVQRKGAQVTIRRM
jgi:hypothetical protein